MQVALVLVNYNALLVNSRNNRNAAAVFSFYSNLFCFDVAK